MGKSPEEKMAMMVDGVQPHCDEPIRAAMICSHAGSLGAVLMQYVTPAGGGLTKTSHLPNPVMIGVGDQNVYAFKYKPKGFKVKLKKGSEVARWPREGLRVESDDSGRVTSQFAIITADEEVFALEVTTAMGGAEVFQQFIDAFGV